MRGKEFLHLKFYTNDEVRLILRHFFYLSALYGVFHLYILIDRAFASLTGEKGVSALTYGLMVATAPRGIVKLEHMAITALSEVKAEIAKVNSFIKHSILISFPFMLIFFLLAEPIVNLFFGHERFTQTDAQLTAIATMYYALSLPFMFIWPILYRSFQVLNWLKPVFFIALCGILANALLNYVFVVVYPLGIKGVCLATFFAYFIQCLMSYAILYFSTFSTQTTQ
jgi:Uncharacterized membrane protein, putative virulence factor